ncbi:MBL fold metallo-hydrolase [Acidaminobacter hydrogenoformans]|uniref:Metal-dependent hydrolase, beta-lactamase superfamily II n=1 Tax=Acidaminobacter hydrogenoformans DSM 2784 TaxID=1120920 RepID=A0A1G5S379_9FIRM|nr:MBL fold metallo-hydrolase [Acidaminobacter hydrogenoformans]SCZ80211.1 Metal-dependent hydrolase, beta-lactamase superfamily II [Acidaminobacter hydrogenoformans DSM 2784]
MKKPCLPIILLLVLSSLTLPSSAITSASTAPSSWSAPYVTAVTKEPGLDVTRLLNSYQNRITRGEFAYLAVSLYDYYTGNTPEAGQASFTDTSDPYVLAAKNAGIVSGYEDGTFRPNNQIRRDELATLFVNLFKATNLTFKPADTNRFADDTSIQTWAKASVYTAKANGIVSGVGANTFNPAGTATREEALIMLYKATRLRGDNPVMEVHFIDVGQGDAALIIKGDQTMLIDGGTPQSDGVIVNYLRAQGLTQLDYLIATHPHVDHIGGLDSVLKTFEVDKVIMPEVTQDTPTFATFTSALKTESLTPLSPQAGARYTLGKADFTLLAPNQGIYDNLNDHSIVLKLTDGVNDFLFTADATALSENEMLQSFRSHLSAEVLKVSHHGSDDASSTNFLNAVSPKYAVISAGTGNDYGLPSLVVLNRLASMNVKLYRTDQLGTIVAKSDGITISFDKVPTAAAWLPGTSTTSTTTPAPVPAPIVSPVPAAPGTVVPNGIIISLLEKGTELVTIKNTTTADVNLQGYILVSEKGNQIYDFPNYLLKAGASVKVASGDATGDLKWTTQNVWNNSDPDPAALYDSKDVLVSRVVK